MSVEDLFQRDSKFKSIVESAENVDSTTMHEDYQGGSVKSSMRMPGD